MEYISIVPEAPSDICVFLILGQLYLPHTSPSGRTTILEVNKVQCSQRRTWFIGDEKIDTDHQGGSILMHYPIDLLLMIIPLCLPIVRSPLPSPFQPLSELIESAIASYVASPAIVSKANGADYTEDLGRLMALKNTRAVLRLACERTVLPAAPPSPPDSLASSPAEAEKSRTRVRSSAYYRPSLPRILALLQTKVDHFAAPERFEQFDHLIRSLARDGLLTTPDLLVGARQKATIEHISQWLSPEASLALAATYDFSALSTYLANRSAAVAAAQQPVVKVNKDAKGEKRKAPAASRGVEALKKVNTASMSKLTNFFKAKDGKK